MIQLMSVTQLRPITHLVIVISNLFPSVSLHSPVPRIFSKAPSRLISLLVPGFDALAPVSDVEGHLRTCLASILFADKGALDEVDIVTQGSKSISIDLIC